MCLAHLITCALAQPQFEHNDLPQLVLVALQSLAKTIKPCRQTGALYYSSFHYLQLLSTRESSGQWSQCSLPRSIEHGLGSPPAQLRGPVIRESRTHQAAGLARTAENVRGHAHQKFNERAMRERVCIFQVL
jgi:hypothetical protein